MLIGNPSEPREAAMETKTDVVVVGAGAAGLAAAKTLAAEGVACTVIEAMGRIGGRAHTSSSEFGVPFDVGCAWLHAADRNPFFPEAQAAGWTLRHHAMGLDHLYFGDRRADEDEMRALAEAETALQAAIETRDAPDDRLASLARACHLEKAVATFNGPMDFGKDDDEISIVDFRGAEDLDPNYLTREGYGALIARWGRDVPVVLGCPARRIRWGGPGVEVETDRGTIEARAVIVTVSTGVLAFDGIRFAPKLPEGHAKAVFDLPMGLLTKVPIRVTGTRLGLEPFDDVLIVGHGRHDLYLLCFPFDLDLVVGFVGGDFAWEMEAAGPAAAVDFLAGRLEGIFGSAVRKHLGHGTMTNWGSEPWVRGAYAVASPGEAAARSILAEPVGDRIWFAGEALAGGLIQTAGGARRSGESTARQVARRLREAVATG
jgi:monoamine oxidase